ncbi:MAG: Protein required for ethanol metabolism [Bathelium mastoideum]|nr:MAG: Protein required for ethanol metabolism [Bathelium mastoideum]
MLRWYQARLARRPVLTQAVTSAVNINIIPSQLFSVTFLTKLGEKVLYATGDVLAQQAVEKRGSKNHDFARTGRMAFYGGAIFGPAATLWFRFLQSHVRLGGPTTTMLAQVACDQSIMASANAACFLATMTALEGGDVGAKVTSTWPTVMKANLMLWPWVQMVNFKVVPLEHRVLVVNIVALGWNCYLSLVNSKADDQAAK